MNDSIVQEFQYPVVGADFKPAPTCVLPCLARFKTFLSISRLGEHKVHPYIDVIKSGRMLNLIYVNMAICFFSVGST